MRKLKHLLDKNKDWVTRMNDSDPKFFAGLADQQKPEILWIGCSDSRVPANQIVDMVPGELFVHRNVANQVVAGDLNCFSATQFAVDVLQVKHVIVCGHYRCGGVLAALHEQSFGLVDGWVEHVAKVKKKHLSLLDKIEDVTEKEDRLCELNVIEQVMHLVDSEVVQNRWKSGNELAIHSWIYDVADGLLKDLGVCITGKEEASEIYEAALQKY